MKRRWPWALGAGLVLAFAGAFFWTKPERDALGAFVAVVNAANRGDVAAAEALCTPEYLGKGRLKLAPEGGVVGFPRGVHKNFQVWWEGPGLLVMPTNREGPVYRMSRTGGEWRFDGLAGLVEEGRYLAPSD